MGLFGPPNVEKLKNKRDIKGLIGALKYRGSALVRKNAALALADLAGQPPTPSLETAIPRLITMLEDPDPGVVTGVVQALGAIGQPAVLPLVSTLRAASERSREGAARALGRLGGVLSEPANLSLAVDPLVSLLRETSPSLRRAAAWALGRISQRMDAAQRSLPAETLIRCLRDPAAEVREAAVYSLARMGEGRAIRPLIGTLDDLSAAVRKGAAEALETLGWQPNSPEEIASFRIARQDWDGAVSVGLSSIAPLTRVTGDSDIPTRTAAIQALGRTGSPEAIAPLVAALKDPIEDVRAAAAAALEKSATSRSIEPLLVAIRDPERSVRVTVAGALGLTQDPRAVPPLVNMLRSHEADSIEAASRALARLGSLSISHLIPLLTDANQFLVQIGSETIQPLIILLQEGASPANKTAASLLGEIGDVRAVRPLIAALTNPELSVQAAQALGKIGDSRAVKPLLDALASPSDSTQRTAAQALGAIGDPQALEPLLQLLRSSDHQTRLDSARALLSMFQSNKLTLAQKRKILENRDRIVTKHTDTGVHQDENRYDWHMDHILHDDSGIGLNFPKEPKV